MITYTLKFRADAHGSAQSIQFEAVDASAALIVAHEQAPDRDADLWEGDRKLCTIRRESVGRDDIWTISGSKDTPEE